MAPSARHDFGALRDLTKKSVRKGKETGGNVRVTVRNGHVRVDVLKHRWGSADSVHIEEGGDTFHTHPAVCDDIHAEDCSIPGPSAQDMSIYANSKFSHIVSGRDFTWLISSVGPHEGRCDDELEALVYDFFKVLEDRFDESSFDGDINTFERAWQSACRLLGLFDVYKFSSG